MKLRVAEIRKKLGLTQDVVAARAGLSRNYLSELESGKKPANTHRLRQIAGALGCSVADLLADPDVDLPKLRLLSAMDALWPEDVEAVIRHAEALARERQRSDIEEPGRTGD